MSSDGAVAIVVAAGRSERFGGGNKVLLPLAGKPVLAHVLDAVEEAARIRSAVIVVSAGMQPAVDQLLTTGRWSTPFEVVGGGERRQDSVAAGLYALPEGAATVAILDGARPLTSGRLIDRCIAAAGAGSAIAAIPVSDTLKRVDEDGQIVRTVPRGELWAAQTPQIFPVACLREAFRQVTAVETTYTDEASLFESLGWPVKVVPGDPVNFKITWPGDVERASLLLAGSNRVAGAHD